MPKNANPELQQKTGPKPKEPVKVEIMAYIVGRGEKRTWVRDEDVYKLAALGCTDREIATWFGCDEQTLRYNFKEIMAKGREDLKQVLRRAMLHNAVANNNAAVQIFLAKNMLGMSDNGMTTDDRQPLPWTDE
jgi:hypothetical protein